MIDDPNPCDPEADDAGRSEQTSMEWLEEAEVELASIPVACQALKTLPGTSALTDELRRAQKRYIQLIAAVRLAENRTLRSLNNVRDGLKATEVAREDWLSIAARDTERLLVDCITRLRSGDVEAK